MKCAPLKNWTMKNFNIKAKNEREIFKPNGFYNFNNCCMFYLGQFMESKKELGDNLIYQLCT